MTTTDLLLADPDLSDVRRGHHDAASLLASSAHAPPPAADAGEATARLAAVVEDLLATTSGLARLQRRLVDRVGETSVRFAGLDVGVAGGLHTPGLVP